MDGQDQAIAAVVEDPCSRKAWEAPVRFASEVEFVGQGTPLEIIAGDVSMKDDGMQQRVSGQRF